ncbi:DsbA family oxidoreductase [Aldersonia sp. NBC_00410]|uniref:DsbA family oxidoreductase n=1 Tax=Aldersonia sp. NBC_00410 TaxID=2975954 RepID=UPI0022502BCC|nr:DsbA family oxidoreductase [Aldersonia sp. NBC_00410]MCX5045424.1 DsbA family oxidoreductase [Aldersonia sp. NBC_00410]
MTVTVDIWTDINCPFCYLGKARFDAALAEFPQRDGIEVVHRSFELDPTLPADASRPIEEHIGRKYGLSIEQVAAKERGMAAQFDEFGLPYLTGRDFGSSFDMHRLLHFAHELGRQEELLDALYAGNFAEPEPTFGSHERLVDIAVRAGFDEAKVRAVLADPDAYADAVRRDEQEAASLGVSGVPFFVFGGKYAVSGAQPPEVFAQALELAWGDRLVPVGVEDAESCGPDGCAVTPTA